ncbi:MAG TPA: hypothetical protein PKE21_00645 [Flavobacteriales bacterium]|nr:hypothetical protein [Flavobacteriales bacterium]HMR25959.1 hypothetical protein [Flavobacteriales bacterium]
MVTDLYLHQEGVASFAWSTNDLDTATADTTFRIDLLTAGPNVQDPSIHEFTQFPGHSNHYLGGLPYEVEHVPSFGHIVWHNAFDNVDITWSSNKVGTKLYLTLYPGADANNVIFRFLGSDSLHVDWQGALRAYLAGRWVELEQAFAYQVIGNTVVPVSWTADWQLLTQAQTVKLIFGTYDPNYPLVLLFGVPEAIGGGGGQLPPPENMTWSTYVGGNMPDEFAAIDMDVEGNPYVCGYSYSNNFPVGLGFSEFAPSQGNFLGTEDMVIQKYRKDNKRLLWSTYHGGSDISQYPSFFHGGQDKAQDIAVYKGSNPDLNFAFITGVTYCTDFPIGRSWNTPHPFAASAYLHPNFPRNQRAVVAAYRQSDGGLCWSTTHGPDFAGYSEEGICIDVDDDGTLAMGGVLRGGSDLTVAGFPYVTPTGAYTKGNGGGFFVLFNSAYQIKWCTPFGSYAQSDWLNDLMITRRSITPFNKVIYMTGWAVSPSPGGAPTGSLDVAPSPLPNAYYQSASAGGTDAYLARLDIDANYHLEYSTYWGGAGQDRGMSLTQSLRATGGMDVFLAGNTTSIDLATYPTMERLPDPGGGVPHRNGLLGISDGFLLRLDDSSDQLTWGTLLGGEGQDALVHVAQAVGDQLLLAGVTRSSTGIATAPNINLYSQSQIGNDPTTQHHDGFFMLLNENRLPVWSSYWGGTKTERCWGIVASEDELYLTGGTNSNQFTFPLREWDPMSPDDYFDGNHLNNNSGTDGGLSWGGFRGGFFTGVADPSATQPDGYICSFAIVSNLSVSVPEMSAGMELPVYLGHAAWLLPWADTVNELPGVMVHDVSGRIIPSRTKVAEGGIRVELFGSVSGIFVATVTPLRGMQKVYKLLAP